MGQTLEEVKKPIGDFIIENAVSTQGLDGAYYHYSEVCKLLRLQEEQMYSEEDLIEAFRQGQDNMECSLLYGFDSKLTEQDWFEQFKTK